MTLGLLNLICKQNNIPPNVHLTSNSGWECDATEMDGLFYNQEKNELMITQESCNSEIVKNSKLGYHCIYNEGHMDEKLFEPECYRCKYCDLPTWDKKCSPPYNKKSTECENFVAI